MRRHAPTRGGYNRRKVTRVEAREGLVVVGVSTSHIDQTTTNPMVGSPIEYGAIVKKVHRRIFLAMKRSDDGIGILELPRMKVG